MTYEQLMGFLREFGWDGAFTGAFLLVVVLGGRKLLPKLVELIEKLAVLIVSLTKSTEEAAEAQVDTSEALQRIADSCGVMGETAAAVDERTARMEQKLDLALARRPDS